jgi:uncharacterized PurR-regulated membrane protein YhhQ (DUF165 family)
MPSQRGRQSASADAHSTWFVVVVAVFISCLIVANIVAVKLVTLFGVMLPAAIIVFPLSYIFGDILTEVYGYTQARRVIWLRRGIAACPLLGRTGRV